MDVSQYLDIFIDETNTHLQTLSDCIMELEKNPENMDTINEIFRAAHSLKGMAGTMGFKRMQRLTHNMESLFQEVRNGTMAVSSELVDVMFLCLDALDAYLENVKASSDEGTQDNEAIVQELNKILEEGQQAGDREVVADEPAQEEIRTDVREEAQAKRSYINKILSFEFTETELKKAKAASKEKRSLYGLTVYIQPDCLLKAARAFLVFQAVEAFGEILAYFPSSQDIEDEKFDDDFSFLLATAEGDADAMLKAAKAVSEIEEVVMEPFRYSVLSQNARVREDEAFAAPAKKEDVDKGTAVAKASAGKPVSTRTIRVDIEKLDALMNQVSELIIAKNSLVSLRSSDHGDLQNNAFHEQTEYLERITTSLHESVMKVRMVPIESVLNKFPRMIRDLSKKLNKKMELHMSGEDTELDRTVVDQIGDPLQHLLRNSADHGLEPAEVRREKGKPETGSIYLKAFQEGNNVIIEVGDDGAGIDTEKVKAKAIERGVITAEQAEAMNQKEIIDLLFLPSFSMADQITDVSGRGVGLDVVKSNIAALGGDVEVESVMGQGTKFTVRLPTTLAIVQALMVEIHHEKYAIALGNIQTIEHTPVSDIKFVQNEEVIHIRGSVIPLIRMNKLLDLEDAVEAAERMIVVIIKKGDRLAGLVVDNLIGQQEIVIKPLGKYMDSTKYISGATILGDGEVALILDVNTLI